MHKPGQNLKYTQHPHEFPFISGTSLALKLKVLMSNDPKGVTLDMTRCPHSVYN
jgi:hypothetical protein